MRLFWNLKPEFGVPDRYKLEGRGGRERPPSRSDAKGAADRIICWRLPDPAPATLKAERKRLIWVNDEQVVAG